MLAPALQLLNWPKIIAGDVNAREWGNRTTIRVDVFCSMPSRSYTWYWLHLQDGNEKVVKIASGYLSAPSANDCC